MGIWMDYTQISSPLCIYTLCTWLGVSFLNFPLTKCNRTIVYVAFRMQSNSRIQVHTETLAMAMYPAKQCAGYNHRGKGTKTKQNRNSHTRFHLKIRLACLTSRGGDWFFVSLPSSRGGGRSWPFTISGSV